MFVQKDLRFVNIKLKKNRDRFKKQTISCISRPVCDAEVSEALFYKFVLINFSLKNIKLYKSEGVCAEDSGIYKMKLVWIDFSQKI